MVTNSVVWTVVNNCLLSVKSQEKANIDLTNWDIVGINPNDKNWSSGDLFVFGQTTFKV